MHADLWKRVEELFQAVQAQPPDKRADFLNRACSDDLEVRREVQSLLDAAPDAASFLDSSPLSSALTPGAKLGHFEILGSLGRGGMGEVYRARDSRLKREVAIKVLPVSFARDPDRIARFEREARAASALNHPNIVSVYDIGRENDTYWIVSELVDGETLRPTIDHGPLRARKAIEIAVQIAEGVAAAHAAGIVHRDLKPGNIMFTRAGRVKILDFGLAKQQHLATDSSTRELTTEGMVLGTAGYMSPEQVRGEDVDHRSDIFSFGVILHEMLAGKQAFSGSSSIEVMNAILKDDPPELPASVPPALARIAGRCLEKAPDRRFQSAADLAFALQAVSPSLRPAVAPKRPAWMSAAFAAIVIAALGIWLWRPAQTSHPVPKVVPLTSYPGAELSPSFSPDGNQVAFAWNGSGSGQTQGNFDIYLKLIGGSEPVRLTHDPADEFSPAWSPDGRFIAFLRTLSADRAGIFLIPAIGGSERKLTEIYQGNPYGPYYGPFLAWFPDGKWLAVVDTASPGEPDALFLLSVESGEKTRLTSPPQKCNDATPALSPDGRTLAFSRFAVRNIADLFLVQLAENLIPSGEPRRLTFENRYSAEPTWTPDGRAIVFSSGTIRTPGLWEIAPPGRAGHTAKPEQLSFAGESASQPVISRQGHLAYALVTLDIDVWKLDLNGGRPAQRPPVDLISSTRIDDDARYSPDGKRIVFVSNRSGSFEIWRCNADGSNPVQLTSFASFFYIDSPRWAPDGRMIYFRYNPGGKPGMYVISSEGGRAKRLDLDDLDALSRDGKWMYFSSNRGGEPQIWKIPANGGDAVQMTRKGGSEAMESPDGRYLYYLKKGAGNKDSLWRLPLEGGDEAQVLESVLNNQYAAIDRGIYFIPDSKPFAVRFLNFDTGEVTIIANIPREPVWGLSVSPDGRSLLYSEFEATRSDLMLVENFR